MSLQDNLDDVRMNRPSQILDTRTQAQKMRRSELAARAEAMGVPSTNDDGTQMTKDQLLVVLQVKPYKPTTRPLGTSAESAGYETWEMHGLRAHAKQCGIVAQNTWKKGDFIQALNAHDASLLGVE